MGETKPWYNQHFSSKQSIKFSLTTHIFPHVFAYLWWCFITKAHINSSDPKVFQIELVHTSSLFLVWSVSRIGETKVLHIYLQLQRDKVNGFIHFQGLVSVINGHSELYSYMSRPCEARTPSNTEELPCRYFSTVFQRRFYFYFFNCDFVFFICEIYTITTLFPPEIDLISAIFVLLYQNY